MNLNKLESKLDDALSKETTESLTNWLNNKRMEKKQTAVDVYEEKSRNIIHLYVNGDIYVRELLITHHNIYYEIKKLNKEQMQFMFECGRNFQLTGEGTFEEVYYEIFKPE